MKLISTHICKGQNIGVHGNLFGGVMLSWLDEAGAAYACQVCDTPRMVTVKMAETVFNRPVRPGQLIKVYGEVLDIGNSSCKVKLQARRHSVYNGTQKSVCETELTYVRIDGDGEAIPISKKVKDAYRQMLEANYDDSELYEIHGGD